MICKTVEELKSHLSTAHPDAYPQSHQQQLQQHRFQQKDIDPATCDICDKVKFIAKDAQILSKKFFNLRLFCQMLNYFSSFTNYKSLLT